LGELNVNFQEVVHSVWVGNAGVAKRRDSRAAGWTMLALTGAALADERNFLGMLMRFAFGDVRDRIVSHKNDHGPS
jgi:hypothetical protein